MLLHPAQCRSCVDDGRRHLDRLQDESVTWRIPPLHWGYRNRKFRGGCCLPLHDRHLATRLRLPDPSHGRRHARLHFRAVVSVPRASLSRVVALRSVAIPWHMLIQPARGQVPTSLMIGAKMYLGEEDLDKCPGERTVSSFHMVVPFIALPRPFLVLPLPFQGLTRCTVLNRPPRLHRTE